MNAKERGTWPKDVTVWRVNETYYFSVPFTWEIPWVQTAAVGLRNRGYGVHIGGPAARLMPEQFDGYSPMAHNTMALGIINPHASRTTRGCDRGCAFCGVQKIEGTFQELKTFVPAPILLDDNFLMSSEKHFNRVIDSLKAFRGIDFTQGLDAQLLTAGHIDRLRCINISMYRFAWDVPADEIHVMRVLRKLVEKGVSKRRIGVYVLINHGESQDEAHFRMGTLKEFGVRGYAMRYQPLDSLQKNSYVDPEWTQGELFRFLQYWNRQRVYGGIPYAEFDREHFSAAVRSSHDIG